MTVYPSLVYCVDSQDAMVFYDILLLLMPLFNRRPRIATLYVLLVSNLAHQFFLPLTFLLWFHIVYSVDLLSLSLFSTTPPDETFLKFT